MGITRTNHSHYEESNIDLFSQADSALYFLDGSSPKFRLLSMLLSGVEQDDRQLQLHLRHFLDLRARMLAAFPPLSPISDDALLAVLGEVSGGYYGGSTALVRLMPGHPDRGDGQPQTEAERKAMMRGVKVLENVGEDSEPPPRFYWDVFAPCAAWTCPSSKVSASDLR